MAIELLRELEWREHALERARKEWRSMVERREEASAAFRASVRESVENGGDGSDARIHYTEKERDSESRWLECVETEQRRQTYAKKKWRMSLIHAGEYPERTSDPLRVVEDLEVELERAILELIDAEGTRDALSDIQDLKGFGADSRRGWFSSSIGNEQGEMARLESVVQEWEAAIDILEARLDRAKEMWRDNRDIEGEIRAGLITADKIAI